MSEFYSLREELIREREERAVWAMRAQQAEAERDRLREELEAWPDFVAAEERDRAIKQAEELADALEWALSACGVSSDEKWKARQALATYYTSQKGEKE